MNALGFNYFGVRNDKVEILNGISGDSTYLLANSLSLLNLKKIDVDLNIKNRDVWQNHSLLIVDDYYLSYNPFFGKKHNQRFVVAEAQTTTKSSIFDIEFCHLPTDELDQAIVGIFNLRRNSILNEASTIDTILIRRLSSRQQAAKLHYIGTIETFAEDLAAKGSQWSNSIFETLHFCVNRPAGPSVIRHEMGNALAILAEHQNCRNLIEMSTVFFKISHQWKIIGNLFFKLSRIWKPKVAVRVYERILRVAKLEEMLGT
jgi:hypothetical protein